MHLANICLCNHTREVHFGGSCSKLDCRCKEFAVIDAGLDVFEALKELVSAVQHDVRDVVGDWRAINFAMQRADAAIRKAREA